MIAVTEDQIIVDYRDRSVRLTAEREAHILLHPEMKEQLDRIKEVIRQPELVIATVADTSVNVYHRWYTSTPVTQKYLQVAIKLLDEDAFVLTAYFSNRTKRGEIVWQQQE